MVLASSSTLGKHSFFFDEVDWGTVCNFLGRLLGWHRRAVVHERLFGERDAIELFDLHLELEHGGLTINLDSERLFNLRVRNLDLHA